jgi:hypothetical protein
VFALGLHGDTADCPNLQESSRRRDVDRRRIRCLADGELREAVMRAAGQRFVTRRLTRWRGLSLSGTVALLLAASAHAEKVLIPLDVWTSCRSPVRLELRFPWVRAVVAEHLTGGDCVQVNWFASRARICCESDLSVCWPLAVRAATPPLPWQHCGSVIQP